MYFLEVLNDCDRLRQMKVAFDPGGNEPSGIDPEILLRVLLAVW
jgi:hypothetical protein